MLAKIFVGLALVAVTVAIHSLGLVAIGRWLLRSPTLAVPRLGRSTVLMICVVWLLMALHVLEIGVWGAFYWWQEAMPNLEAALYFSGVTYATIGFGDLLLPDAWRFLAPVEGLVGSLLGGLSTAFFFALLLRIYGSSSSDPGRH